MYNLPELTHLFICSFYIFGLYYAFHFDAVWMEPPNVYGTNGHWQYKPNESNIFGWFHFQLRRVVSEYWCKPIFGCVVCMASVHGTYFYWLFFPDSNVIQWVVSLVAVAGINSLLKQWLPQ